MAGVKRIGPRGGVLAAASVTVEVPRGALDRQVALSARALARHELEALAPLDHGGARRLLFASDVVALTPHGTSFAVPARVRIPYKGRGVVVLRLADERDDTWEPVEGAEFDGSVAHFQIDGFSLYAVASVDEESGPWPDDLLPEPEDLEPTTYIEGEFVVEVDDTGTRTNGYEQLIYDGRSLFWTHEREGKFAIHAADLTQTPTSAKTLFEAPWNPDSGWSAPPLVATNQYLVLPLIGSLALPSGTVRSDGWASIRKDGTGLRLDLFENWWLVARGDELLVPTFYEGTFLIAADTGARREVPEAEIFTENCVYDAARDQMGCLNYGIGIYDFASGTSAMLSEAPEIIEPMWGSKHLTFNTTHWFAPMKLLSGNGIGAFARDGSGVTRYENVAALGAIVVDDTHLYACLAGTLTRIALSDQTRATLAEDCGDAYGIAIVASDANSIYYVHASRQSSEFPRVRTGGKLPIHRAPKTPQR